ncbi:MAG: hypothetical protein LUE14_09760, partial [Clostridiales bacterium]|nr:hypothetical protein [Clostridiales bacterium]
METLLGRIPLQDLWNRRVMFDANIFMVGIENRGSDKNCSFDHMLQTYIRPIFDCFTDIVIHEEVYAELDDEAKNFMNTYIGKTVTIVSENGMYGTDPLYTSVFNHIAGHELVRYERGQSKNRGEIYSLAYAAYHHINYLCSKDAMVDIIANELDDLKDIDIITFDIVVLSAYVHYAWQHDNSHAKALKSIYKKYCADVIKRHKLPDTLGKYIIEIQ